VRSFDAIIQADTTFCIDAAKAALSRPHPFWMTTAGACSLPWSASSPRSPPREWQLRCPSSSQKPARTRSGKAAQAENAEAREGLSPHLERVSFFTALQKYTSGDAGDRI